MKPAGKIALTKSLTSSLQRRPTVLLARWLKFEIYRPSNCSIS